MLTSSQTISRNLFFILFSHMKNRVTYKWGAKADKLWADSATYSHFDCSGFQQFIIFRSSQGGIHLPEGSADQHQWCIDNGLEQKDYADVCANRDYARIFICFMAPTDTHPGHVWCVCAGVTYECYGSGGVNSRTAMVDHPAHCDACFELPCTD